MPGLGIRLARLRRLLHDPEQLLVAVAAVQLARDPLRDGVGFRVVRLAAVVGIAVTGVVHFFLLRPLLDLDGADWVADKLLHMAVPAAGRRRVGAVRPAAPGRPRARLAGSWPGRWPGWARRWSSGRVTGWYPYPFLDHREDGWDHVRRRRRSGSRCCSCVLFAVVARSSTAGPGRPRRTPWVPSPRDRSAAMTDRHRPDRPAQRHRLRRVRGGRRLVGAPAPLRPVRPRRLLRLLPRPARHARTSATTGHPVVQSFEPGEDWFWDFARRDGRATGPSSRRRPRVPTTSRCPARRSGCPLTGASHVH